MAGANKKCCLAKKKRVVGESHSVVTEDQVHVVDSSDELPPPSASKRLSPTLSTQPSYFDESTHSSIQADYVGSSSLPLKMSKNNKMFLDLGPDRYYVMMKPLKGRMIDVVLSSDPGICELLEVLKFQH